MQTIHLNPVRFQGVFTRIPLQPHQPQQKTVEVASPTTMLAENKTSMKRLKALMRSIQKRWPRISIKLVPIKKEHGSFWAGIDTTVTQPTARKIALGQEVDDYIRRRLDKWGVTYKHFGQSID